MVEDGFALPVCGFEFAVFGALLADLYSAILLRELGVDFLLAFWADAFGFTHL